MSLLVDRRRFLGLLGGTAAAAVVAPQLVEPERLRSYFFGPWQPHESGLFAKDGLALVEGPPPPDMRYLVDLVDKRIIPRAAATAAQFIPEIWSADVLQAVQVNAMFDIERLNWQVAFVRTGDGRGPRVHAADYVAFAVEDLLQVQSEPNLREQYARKANAAFERADRIRAKGGERAYRRFLKAQQREIDHGWCPPWPLQRELGETIHVPRLA